VNISQSELLQNICQFLIGWQEHPQGNTYSCCRSYDPLWANDSSAFLMMA